MIANKHSNIINKFTNNQEYNVPPVEKQRDDTNALFLYKMQYPRDEKLFRDYQMNIVKTCLLNNTLVCLPTGLGKTFIASVIMYNFHLWFSGKIFFFAPTKPLVNQQKDSFLSMFKELSELVTEVNGSVSGKNRISLYSSFKFFFMTPQTLDNDLSKELLDCSKVSLLIFDEAHKAQKKFAYTNIVSKISEAAPQNKFRTVALSASPGSSQEAIQSMICSLKIKSIELRTENDPDLKPFLFNKEIKIVEINSSNDITKMKDWLDRLLTKRVEILKKYKIIDASQSVKYLGKKKVLDYMQLFKEKKSEFENEIGPSMIKEMHINFSLIMRLLNSKSLLMDQGIDSFKESIKKFFDDDENHKSSSKMKNFQTPMKDISASKKNMLESEDFMDLVKEIFSNEDLPLSAKIKFPFLTPNRKIIQEKTEHPKMVKLTEILFNYHSQIKNNSRVIIFTQFKDSAKEIHAYVTQCGKFCDINFSIFTGQNKDFKQKDQLEVMRRFREGQIRVLIATSVAEEGLDIGEVDLIICYDMASTSPIKMIQRFGRTGRKRNGCVIVLASKGEEKSKYFKALHRMKCINKELSKLKFDVDRCKIKFYPGLDNVLVLSRNFIEKIEFFDLENEVIEHTENLLSDDEDDDEECENISEEDNPNFQNINININYNLGNEKDEFDMNLLSNYQTEKKSEFNKNNNNSSSKSYCNIKNPEGKINNFVNNFSSFDSRCLNKTESKNIITQNFSNFKFNIPKTNFNNILSNNSNINSSYNFNFKESAIKTPQNMTKNSTILNFLNTNNNLANKSDVKNTITKESSPQKNILNTETKIFETKNFQFNFSKAKFDTMTNSKLKNDKKLEIPKVVTPPFFQEQDKEKISEFIIKESLNSVKSQNSNKNVNSISLNGASNNSKNSINSQNGKTLKNFKILKSKTNSNSKFQTEQKVEKIEEINRIPEIKQLTFQQKSKKHDDSPFVIRESELYDIINNEIEINQKEKINSVSVNTHSAMNPTNQIDDFVYDLLQRESFINNLFPEEPSKKEQVPEDENLFEYLQRQSVMDNILNYINSEGPEYIEGRNSKLGKSYYYN
jgi:ERCC4-related helicase